MKDVFTLTTVVTLERSEGAVRHIEREIKRFRFQDFSSRHQQPIAPFQYSKGLKNKCMKLYLSLELEVTCAWFEEVP